MKKRLSQKQKNISIKCSKMKEKVNEQVENIPVKKRINRLSFLLSTRMVSKTVGQNQVAALSLLNQAYQTADYDEAMAVKLMNIARRLSRKKD